MQSIPVDVTRLGTLRCVVEPEPRTDFETGEIKKNREGVVTWTVGMSVRQADSRRTSIVEVSVPGEPVGVVEGAEVAVVGLTAFAWEQGGRHGMSFRADAVTPVTEGRSPAPEVKSGKASGGAA